KAGRILADLPAPDILKPGLAAEVAALVDVPLRQARRINDLHAEKRAADLP
ncbi:MAG: hypothetical protein JSS20_20480, partial [Proteobacteria bacterium]|nr:hypothetical protein [Pseudomonadota bacterium]